MADKLGPTDPGFKPDVPATIDPEAFYDVTVWRSFPHYGGFIRPSAESIRLKGSEVTKHMDSILVAKLPTA